MAGSFKLAQGPDGFYYLTQNGGRWTSARHGWRPSDDPWDQLVLQAMEPFLNREFAKFELSGRALEAALAVGMDVEDVRRAVFQAAFSVFVHHLL